MVFLSPEAAAAVSNTAPEKLWGGSERSLTTPTKGMQVPALHSDPSPQPGACAHSRPSWGKAPLPAFGTA